MLGCYPPRPAVGVCGADAGRYNAGAVLPQGASDVQSIRAAQTADPRAKQTPPLRSRTKSARINAMPGDGGSPYSMTVGHFHSEKVVESFLGELPFAWPSSACGCTTLCVAAANLDRRWIGVDISPKAVELVNIRLQQSLSDLLATARTDIGAPVPYRPEQACPVRPAARPVQRMPERAPVPQP